MFTSIDKIVVKSNDVKLESLKFLDRNSLITAKSLLPVRPKTLSFNINCETSFINLLRQTIVGKIPRKILYFDRDNFVSTESYIHYDDLLMQFMQIYIDQDVNYKGKISYYAENMTFINFMDYDITGLKLDGKKMDLKKYSIDPLYTMGKIFKGCYIDIKDIYVKETTKFGLIQGFTYKGLEDKPFDTCTKYSVSFNSYMEPKRIIKKACKIIIDNFTEYKSSVKKEGEFNMFKLEGDEGAYAALIQEQGFINGDVIKSKRIGYTKIPYTEVSIDGEINNLIDEIIKSYQIFVNEF